MNRELVLGGGGGGGGLGGGGCQIQSKGFVNYNISDIKEHYSLLIKSDFSLIQWLNNSTSLFFSYVNCIFVFIFTKHAIGSSNKISYPR